MSWFLRHLCQTAPPCSTVALFEASHNCGIYFATIRAFIDEDFSKKWSLFVSSKFHDALFISICSYLSITIGTFFQMIIFFATAFCRLPSNGCCHFLPEIFISNSSIHLSFPKTTTSSSLDCVFHSNNSFDLRIQ